MTQIRPLYTLAVSTHIQLHAPGSQPARGEGVHVAQPAGGGG